jgi:hypothetical protein
MMLVNTCVHHTKVSQVQYRSQLTNLNSRMLRELNINHYIVPVGRTGELQAKTRRRFCAGNCFAMIMILWPWLAVHKENLGHALSLNMRCEAIHDGEIFPNHGVLTMPAGPTWLAFLPRHFFWYTYYIQTENVWLFNYLEINFREYQIYSSQKCSSNHSQRSQTSSSMVVLRICKQVARAL